MATINWKRNLFLVWLSQIMSLAAFSAVLPFIPLFIREHFKILDDAERGFWVSIFYFAGQAGFCIFTPLWGALSDRYGRRLMLLRANFGSAIFMPLMAVAPSMFWLILIRVIAGACSGTVNAAQTLICSTTPERHLGTALGTLSSALWSGNMLGFFFGGIITNRFGYTTAFFSCGILLAGAGLVTLLVREDFVPPNMERRRVAMGRISRPRSRFSLPSFSTIIWTLLILFLFIGIARNFDVPFIAIQVELINGIKDAAYWTGIICAAAALAGIASGLLMGYLSDRYSAIKIALPCVALSIFLMIAQGASTNLLSLGISRFLLFFFAGGLDPVFQTILSRVTPLSKRGLVFGWSASARVGGSVVSSLVGGAIIYNLGVRWIFYGGSMVFLLLLPLMYIALQRTKKYLH